MLILVVVFSNRKLHFMGVKIPAPMFSVVEMPIARVDTAIATKVTKVIPIRNVRQYLQV